MAWVQIAILFTAGAWVFSACNDSVPSGDRPDERLARTAASQLQSARWVLADQANYLASQQTPFQMEEVISALSGGADIGARLFAVKFGSNNFWMQINPAVDLWTSPKKAGEEVAIYVTARLPEAGSSATWAVTFGRDQVRLSGIPKWRALSAEGLYRSGWK